MILVEFTGLPGCGKTTLCDKLEEELANRDIRVCNLQKEKEIKNIFGRLSYSLYIRKVKKAECNNVLNAEIRRMNNLLGIKETDHWEEKILEANYRCIEAEKKGEQVALFDEGCIQYIVSLLADADVDERQYNIIKEIEKTIYGSRTIIINCALDEETSLDRINSRGRWCCGVHDTDREGGLAILRHRRSNIDLIMEKLEKVKILTVSTKDGNGDNALKEVLNAVTENIG